MQSLKNNSYFDLWGDPMKAKAKNQETPHGDQEKQSVSALELILKSALAVINPLSDVKFLYRSSLRPLVVKLRTLREETRSVDKPTEPLSFEQAVQRSGKTISQLQGIYRRRQLFWSFPMLVSGVLSPITLIIIAAASNLPTVTLARALVVSCFLGSFSFFCYTRSLIAAYRHWQLSTGRGSPNEGGEFTSFLREIRPVLDIVLLRYHTINWK